MRALCVQSDRMSVDNQTISPLKTWLNIMSLAKKSVSLFEDGKTVERIITVVEAAGIPVSVDYVATNLNMNWASARAVLLQLSLEGRLKAVKTTKSWIFFLPDTSFQTQSPRSMFAKIVPEEPDKFVSKSQENAGDTRMQEGRDDSLSVRPSSLESLKDEDTKSTDDSLHANPSSHASRKAGIT